VLYPIVTIVAVLGTANHFFLDVVGGALTFAIAGLIAWSWQRRRVTRSRPVPVPATVSVTTS
jgi:membrane-associated phospholipid phosphatase